MSIKKKLYRMPRKSCFSKQNITSLGYSLALKMLPSLLDQANKITSKGTDSNDMITNLALGEHIFPSTCGTFMKISNMLGQSAGLNKFQQIDIIWITLSDYNLIKI